MVAGDRSWPVSASASSLMIPAWINVGTQNSKVFSAVLACFRKDGIENGSFTWRYSCMPPRNERAIDSKATVYRPAIRAGGVRN